MQTTGSVVIGMDPHKRSVTIEVMAGDETILGGGRFTTDVEGFREMRGVRRPVEGAGVGDRGLRRDRRARRRTPHEGG
jgi:hypothetical protein